MLWNGPHLWTFPCVFFPAQRNHTGQPFSSVPPSSVALAALGCVEEAAKKSLYTCILAVPAFPAADRVGTVVKSSGTRDELNPATEEKMSFSVACAAKLPIPSQKRKNSSNFFYPERLGMLGWIVLLTGLGQALVYSNNTTA